MAREPSEAPELVGQLREAGWRDVDLGRALGRDSSLIFQVGAGRKPGRNLVPSLRALLGTTPSAAPAVPEPARRTTAAGRLAKTRAGEVGGTGWRTIDVKRQAARSGAKGILRAIEDAAATGRHFALDVTLPKSVRVEQSGRRDDRRSRRPGRNEQVVTIGEGGELNPDVWAAYVQREHGGDVTAAVAAYLVESGRAEAVSREDVRGIQFRSWSG